MGERSEFTFAAALQFFFPFARARKLNLPARKKSKPWTYEYLGTVPVKYRPNDRRGCVWVGAGAPGARSAPQRIRFEVATLDRARRDERLAALVDYFAGPPEEEEVQRLADAARDLLAEDELTPEKLREMLEEVDSLELRGGFQGGLCRPSELRRDPPALKQAIVTLDFHRTALDVERGRLLMKLVGDSEALAELRKLSSKRGNTWRSSSGGEHVLFDRDAKTLKDAVAYFEAALAGTPGAAETDGPLSQMYRAVETCLADAGAEELLRLAHETSALLDTPNLSPDSLTDQIEQIDVSALRHHNRRLDANALPSRVFPQGVFDRYSDPPAFLEARVRLHFQRTALVVARGRLLIAELQRGADGSRARLVNEVERLLLAEHVGNLRGPAADWLDRDAETEHDAVSFLKTTLEAEAAALAGEEGGGEGEAAAAALAGEEGAGEGEAAAAAEEEEEAAAVEGCVAGLRVGQWRGPLWRVAGEAEDRACADVFDMSMTLPAGACSSTCVVR